MRRKALKGLKVAGVGDYRHALRRGVAASIEHDELPLPGDFETVYDVGANRGQFMLWAAHRFPKARIVCFEPIPAAREKLASVLPDAREITIEPVALSSERGTAEFHVAEDDDSSSLHAAGEVQLEMAPGSAEASTISVELATLDDYVGSVGIERPSLLKIDVQGHELEVLEGARRSFQQLDWILVECSFVELYTGQALAPAVIELLEANGFELVDMFTPTTDNDGIVIQADALFRRAA